MRGLTAAFRRERASDTLTVELPPGRYVIVPMTFDPIDDPASKSSTSSSSSYGAAAAVGTAGNTRFLAVEGADGMPVAIPAPAKPVQPVPFQLTVLADGPVVVRGEAAGEVTWSDPSDDPEIRDHGRAAAAEAAAAAVAREARLHVVHPVHAGVDDCDGNGGFDGHKAAGRRQAATLLRALTRAYDEMKEAEAALRQRCALLEERAGGAGTGGGGGGGGGAAAVAEKSADGGEGDGREIN